jgi:hypothetical protein
MKKPSTPRRTSPAKVAPTPEMLRLAEQRIVIANVTPQLDGGRYPIKREVGDKLEVQADIFRDGRRPQISPLEREAVVGSADARPGAGSLGRRVSARSQHDLPLHD